MVIPSTSSFEFTLNVGTTTTVYLACSWRQDVETEPPSLIIRELDNEGVLVVGDIKVDTSSPQDDDRIRRIMRSCTGFVGILPFRHEHQSTTSIYMIRELTLAISLNLPIAIFVDSRVAMENVDGRPLMLGNTPIERDTAHVYGPFRYDYGDSRMSGQLKGHLYDFLEDVTKKRPTEEPFVFLDARMQTDFELARTAISVAVERVTGIPCLWFGDPRVSTNAKSIRQRTRELVRRCSILIADLTYGKENPRQDNPNRAHEVGYAEAYERPILLFAQGPRRDPYFAASDMEVLFWQTEQDLHEMVASWFEANRRLYARRIFNREIAGGKYILSREFKMNRERRYIAPNMHPLTPLEGWVIAGGFGCLAFSLSSLVKEWTGYGETLDLAPIIAALTAIVFSSNIGENVKRALGEHAILRWLIPLVGFGLLIAWITISGNRAGHVN